MEGSLRVIKATEGLQTAPNRFNYDMSLVSMNANTVCVSSAVEVSWLCLNVETNQSWETGSLPLTCKPTG